MKVNADAVLLMLIQRKAFFFRLLDEMDKHHDNLPLPFYKQAFFHELNQISDDLEREKFQNAMQPENLYDAGLLVSLDHHAGSLKWQGFVSEMFRHLDRARLRRLTDPELQQFRERIFSLADKLSALENQVGSTQWNDTVRPAFDTLHEIHARIRENTESLRHRAEHLAEIVDGSDLADAADSEKSRAALDEIGSIYRRSILPLLEFLNQDEDIKDGKTPMSGIDAIADLFSRTGQPATARRVLLIKNGIRSFYKDIYRIRQDMERYVRQSETMRRQYDAVETLYNRLRQAVETLQDGRLRGSKISFQAALSHPFPHFVLHKPHYDKPINWQQGSEAARFAEHLRVQLDRTEPPQTNIRVARQPENSIQALKQRQHESRMKQLVRQYRVPVSDDLHRSLHDYLQHRLPDYTLADLSNALSWLRILHHVRPVPVFGLKSLHHRHQTLHYHALSNEVRHD